MYSSGDFSSIYLPVNCHFSLCIFLSCTLLYHLFPSSWEPNKVLIPCLHCISYACHPTLHYTEMQMRQKVDPETRVPMSIIMLLVSYRWEVLHSLILVKNSSTGDPPYLQSSFSRAKSFPSYVPSYGDSPGDSLGFHFYVFNSCLQRLNEKLSPQLHWCWCLCLVAGTLSLSPLALPKCHLLAMSLLRSGGSRMGSSSGKAGRDR